MGGAVIGNANLVGRIRGDALVDAGGVISPFNAWLILRGSVTLPLRLRQQVASAERVAAFLEADLASPTSRTRASSHPQHDLARRQFSQVGPGAMLAFALDGDGAVQDRFVNALRVITSAVSLGHDETLIVHVGPSGRGGSEHYPAPFQEYGHLRLSIGLEDVDDLLADLAGRSSRRCLWTHLSRGGPPKSTRTRRCPDLPHRWALRPPRCDRGV